MSQSTDFEDELEFLVRLPLEHEIHKVFHPETKEELGHMVSYWNGERQRLLRFDVAGKEIEKVEVTKTYFVPRWDKDESTATPAWIALSDPEGWYKATVRWDGCVDFLRYYNHPFIPNAVPWPHDDEEIEHIHICDIDDMIARLQAIKTKAIEHFGEEWPE